LATTTFTMSTSTGMTVTGFSVRRVGGGNGETAAKVNGGAVTTFVGGLFSIDFATTYGTGADLTVKPGETAEYVVSALIGGVGASASLSASIENLDTVGIRYTHNTGTTGVDGADTAAVFPLLSGVTNVRGGSLSN